MCWCNKSKTNSQASKKRMPENQLAPKSCSLVTIQCLAEIRFLKTNDENGQKLTLPGSGDLCSFSAPIFSSYNQLMWHQVGSQDCNQKSERCFFKKSRRIATIVARSASRMIQAFTDQIKLMLLMFIKHASVTGYNCLWHCVAS